MTNWEYIKSLDEKEIARRICLSFIPDDECSPMFIHGVGHFDWEEDVEDWLKAEHREEK